MSDEQQTEVADMVAGISSATVDTAQLQQAYGNADQVSKNLGLVDPHAISTDGLEDTETLLAKDAASKLFNVDYADPKTKQAIVAAMQDFQKEAVATASFTSEKLNAKMMSMSGSAEGGPMVDAMVELDLVMTGLHPKNHNMEDTWLTNLISFFYKGARPIRKYFMLMQSQQSVLDGFMQNIKDGIKERETDARILEADRTKLQEIAGQLERSIKIGLEMDTQMEILISDLTDEKDKTFFQAEVLFALRQSVGGLQEYLAVVNQGIMAMELLMRLNRETINSANRSINITMNTLKIGSVLATVMAGMAALHEKIEKMNETANDMVAYNANLLATTTIKVGEMARSTTLDLDVLEAAFDTIHTAHDNEVAARIEALDGMKNTIGRIGTLNEKSKQVNADLEKGRLAKENLDENVLNNLAVTI